MMKIDGMMTKFDKNYAHIGPNFLILININ